MNFPNFSSCKILVVGDVMLDQYWLGQTDRVSPEAPVPVVKLSDIENRAGGAANVALNAASLGAKVKLMSFVGTDYSANILTKILKDYCVENHFISIADRPTIKKLRILSMNQQLLRVDDEQGFFNVDESNKAAFINIFKRQIENVDVVAFSDYHKGCLADVNILIDIAKQFNKKTIYDPKILSLEYYQGLDCLKPNLDEWFKLTGISISNAYWIEQSQKLLKKYRIKNLVLTAGKHGIWIMDHDAHEHIKAQGKEVYDVTGAGDTVLACLATGMAADMKFSDIAHIAAHAAGIVVSKIGTSVIDLKMLYRQVKDEQLIGIVQEHKLRKLIRFHQTRGEKIVFANGCYDVLHHGHIRFLHKARALGDRLVVALNTDESVRQCKGSNRPHTSLQERMEVIASLRCVDWVIAFNEIRPGRIIESLSPDILAKTDEHFAHVNMIPKGEGAEHVLAKGGQIYFISRTKDISSTQLLNM